MAFHATMAGCTCRSPANLSATTEVRTDTNEILMPQVFPRYQVAPQMGKR